MLRTDPAAVRAARGFVADQLAGSTAVAAAASAELVVTELVTNALLHGSPPLLLHVRVTDGRVRLTVHDGSPLLPRRPADDPGAMTGRGLRLVEALASRWGVHHSTGGKAVWAEVAPPGTPPPDDLAAVDPGDGERAAALPPVDELDGRAEVVVRDVPTALLVAAKAYVDDVVRELTLATTGARSGQAGDVPPGVPGIVAAISAGFTEAREAIKHQAGAAVADGLERTDLVLRLPLSAADGGRAYLDALDEADRHARASRLLVLEEPPQHRSFRRWYVSSLVAQLDAAASGQPAPVQPTLEQHLLAELDSVAAAQRQVDRSARLQEATAALASVRDVNSVARLALAKAVAALDATSGALLVTTSLGPVLEAAVGCPPAMMDRLRADPPDAALPVAVAEHAGTELWLESRSELEQTAPEMLDVVPSSVAVVALPLRTAGRTVGAVQLGFDASRLFDTEERGYLRALAAQIAQALERCMLYASAQRARAEAEVAAATLLRLHEVTARLAASTDVTEVVDVVTAVTTRRLGARLAAICLLDPDGDTMRLAGLFGGAPGAMERWSSFSLQADVPSAEAARTGRPVVAPSRAELERRYPALVGHLADDQAFVCVPLANADRTLGSLALSFPSGRTIDDAEVGLVTTIANQCVLALDRATSLAAERRARQRAAFLADAGPVLASSLEPVETIQHLVDLVVPAAADWAVVYLADDAGRVSAATAAHRDPDLTAALISLQRRQSPSDGALGRVLSTGESLLYPRVPDDARARVAEHPDLAPHADEVLPSTALAVALTVGDQTLGALALVRVEGEAYTDEDVRLFEQLATRGAVAIDNARRFGRERDTALTLQRSLLPQQLPRVPGVELAWRYLPGTAGTHVGGDWYDVVTVGDGRVALLIGDVMGRGLRAAAVMGQLRAIARARLTTDPSPAQVLVHLDGALARLEGDQIATAVLGLLDPVARTLTLASAGHLPPLMVPGDGTSAFVHVEAGPPLGVGSGRFPERRMQLPPRCTLLLYTDGLVEDRSLPVDEGMHRLAEAAAGAVGPARLCDRALSALGRDVGADDDTALLAVGLA